MKTDTKNKASKMLHELACNTSFLNDVGQRPTARLTSDGRLSVSAEDEHGFADYFGEFRGGFPGSIPASRSLPRRTVATGSGRIPEKSGSTSEPSANVNHELLHERPMMNFCQLISLSHSFSVTTPSLLDLAKVLKNNGSVEKFFETKTNCQLRIIRDRLGLLSDRAFELGFEELAGEAASLADLAVSTISSR